MIGRLNLWIVFGVLLATSMGASTAKAQFMSGGGYGLGFFNYGNTGRYFERIPYYALYPPVYYSYPVPRTYGYSPFAYPPGTMTPEMAPKVQAATYINPYVPRETKPAAADSTDKSVDSGGRLGPNRLARVARTYINPYVAQAASNESLTSRVDQ